jgi:hypothetical protein
MVRLKKWSEEMAEEKSQAQPQTLEMRVAAIEDKLAALQITEQEMAAYQKVSSLLAGGRAMAVPSAAPLGVGSCVQPHGVVYIPCWKPWTGCAGTCIPQVSPGFGSYFGGFGT